MLGTGLVRNDRRHPKDQGIVPSGGEADRLRKRRRESRARNAVQRLVPPVVCRNPESLDRGRDVLHLRHLLLEREARDEIAHATLEGEVGIPIVGRLRGETCGSEPTPHERDEQRVEPAHGWVRAPPPAVSRPLPITSRSGVRRSTAANCGTACVMKSANRVAASARRWASSPCTATCCAVGAKSAPLSATSDSSAASRP